MKINNLLKISALMVGLFMSVSAKAQTAQDTLYYNENWRPISKDSAAYYRVPVKEVDGKFQVRDFYSNGQLQMEGASLNQNREVWDGEVTWYTKEGAIQQKATYSNGKLEGDFTTYKDGKKYVATYANNYFISGSTFFKAGSVYRFTTKKNDTVTEIISGINGNGIRYEEVRLNSGPPLKTTYYGKNGKLLGSKTILPNNKYKGIEVRYYYNPMRVARISSAAEGDYQGATVYYPNGIAREIFDKKELTKTYYDTLGVTIGKGIFERTNGRLDILEGDYISFYSESIPERADLIRAKRVYKESKLVSEFFYRKEDTTLEREVFYENGDKVLQKSYDEDGEVIAQMVYKNWLPFEGTEIQNDRKVSYKEGKLIEELEYYPKSEAIFKKRLDSIATFYDRQGKVLGSLKVKDNLYGAPIEGEQYYLDGEGDIWMVQEYKNEYITRKTSFRKRLLPDGEVLAYKKIEEYESDSYNLSREINFYSNGIMQSDIYYEDYKKVKGIFYTKEGKEMGRYDFKNKDGVRYEFFPDSDVIKEQEKRENGEQIIFKKYDRGEHISYEIINPILIEDIDIDCCAAFYNKNGEMIAKATFKNRKLQEGTVYDSKTRELYTIENGVRQGPYKKFYYDEIVIQSGNYINDKKEGVFKEFTSQGQLLSELNYKEDLLDGMSRYYNKEGNVSSEMEYRANVPMNGTRQVVKKYGTLQSRETYKEGQIIQKAVYEEKGLRVNTYKNKQEVNVVVFHEDSDKKRLEYTLLNNYVHGVVKSYSKDGEIVNTAKVQNGKLISGTLDIISSLNDRDIKFMRLSKNDKTVTIGYIDFLDKEVFVAREYLDESNIPRFINKHGVSLSYIYGNMLY